MTMEFDTITTITLITFGAEASGVRSSYKIVEISTSPITIPRSTTESTSASLLTSTVNGQPTAITATTIVPEDDGSSPSNAMLMSTSYSSISNPSDRASSVLTTSSPTVPTADSPSTPRPTSNNSIAPGAAAGIGVGSAAAGAFIAALIVWFIMRKARKSPQIPNDDPGGSWLSSNTA
ncbi:hypothetical protein MMC22_009195 [Lobaria immixta]|nr:hypothetical protein [Lobaria immixta]